jgi:hypothetical protein
VRAFQHIPTGFIIGLSKKCLYTFHARHPEFEELPNFSGTPHYFICRNPFTRIQSLYLDKCKGSALTDGPTQVCQSILMKHFRLEKKSELAGISFGAFCQELPKVMPLEEHFWPQVRGYVPPSNRIIRAEYDLPMLALATGVDYGEKANATSHGHWTEIYGQTALHSVKNAYAEDFQMFNY